MLGTDRFRVAPALLLGFALASCGSGRGRTPPPVVHVADPGAKRAIASGELVGFLEKNQKTQTWLGVPFAKPPLGALRWRPPQAPAPWSGVREALRFGSACPQLANPISDAPGAEPGSLTGNEDCLYLNVFAPRASAEDAAKRKLPVMVWFHGGSNTMGHAGSYDGSELAARYDLVVITTNYRLGPFGWFRHPALIGDARGDDQSGNWGTLDQIRALEWVRDNVAAFGGDPGNVTIFGESAGGSDVFSLLVSPRAAGLFQRAIAQSGGTHSVSLAAAENLQDAPERGDKNSSQEAALRILFPMVGRAAALERSKALKPDEIAARLRAAKAGEVFAAYTANADANGADNLRGELRMPILLRDGYTLPSEEVAPLLAQGRYNRVPVILGTNRDELKLFQLGDPHFVRRWIRPLPTIRDEKRYQLTSDYASLSWKLRSADEPAAAMRAVQGPSVYVYRFDWDEEPKFLWSDFAKLLGACHGMEIPFVFHRFDGAFAQLFTPKNELGREQLADAMSSYWANFAYTGSPGRGRNGRLPEWRAVDPSDGGPKQIIFDSADGGGVRMDSSALTKTALLAQMARDPRMDDALHCEMFQGMVEHDGLLASDRAAAGCSEKALKELTKR